MPSSCGRRGAGSNPVDDDGVCRRFRAGGLEFRCDEPFVQSTMTYEGTAVDTTAQALAEANLADGPRVDLEVHVEVRMAAPPWVPGTLVAEAAEVFHEGFAGALHQPALRAALHDPRHGAGRQRGVDVHRHRPADPPPGRTRHRGLLGPLLAERPVPQRPRLRRARVPGPARTTTTFNEGYVFDGERLIAATLVDAPWLRRRQPTGEDASITLRTADGDIHIEGETVLSTYVAAGSHPEFPPLLQQAGARYRWDGEETLRDARTIHPRRPTRGVSTWPR